MLCDFHFRYNRGSDKGRHGHKGKDASAVCGCCYSSWWPLPPRMLGCSHIGHQSYLSCGSLGGVSPTLSTSGEDTGAGPGDFWMAFSSLFMMAPEKAGSLVEDF